MSTTLSRRVLEKPDEDLFAETKMSFGEHLNELRSCLFKAILALAVGFVIGLAFGERVVKLIQTPLEKALITYYEETALESAKLKIAERRKQGEAIPPYLADDAVLNDLVIKQGMLFEETFIAPDEIMAQARQLAPGAVPSAPPTAPQAPAVPQAPAAGAGAAAAPQLMRIFLWHRAAEDDRIRIKSLNVQETFMIYVKAAFLAGAIVASPAVFYFMWSFVAAGLYPHERRYVHVFLPVSIGLFLAGAGLAFCFVFEPVLGFLFSFNRSLGIDPDPRISEWLSFVLLMPLGFGVSFQLPLVLLFLERIGVFTVETYLAKWRIAVLVIAIASMVLSPGGDPYSMMMMFVPLTLLYFGGVAACYYLGRSRRPTS